MYIYSLYLSLVEGTTLAGKWLTFSILSSMVTTPRKFCPKKEVAYWCPNSTNLWTTGGQAHFQGNINTFGSLAKWWWCSIFTPPSQSKEIPVRIEIWIPLPDIRKPQSSDHPSAQASLLRQVHRVGLFLHNEVLKSCSSLNTPWSDATN